MNHYHDRHSLEEVAQTHWDAVIVGAGAAGGVAAAMLAARRWRVLLVEKSRWPREKVCGACLNADAIESLTRARLGAALRGAQRLDRVTWNVGRGTLDLPMPVGAALCRSDLDAAIVAEAEDLGCTFFPGVGATLLPCRPGDAERALEIRSGTATAAVHAGVVLVCDGIGGTCLEREPWAKWRTARNAWMGVSTTCPTWPDHLRAGSIHMHVGAGGYAGLVCLADGRAHLAAALDPAACRAAGGPGPLISGILKSCRRPLPPELIGARFRGSGLLTRTRRELGGHRVLTLGDACGYVEPFTGQGMACAVSCAKEAVELLPAPNGAWPIDLPDRWRRRHAASIGPAQRWCHAWRPVMHHPTMAAAALAFGRFLPKVGILLASGAARPQSLETN